MSAIVLKNRIQAYLDSLDPDQLLLMIPNISGSLNPSNAALLATGILLLNAIVAISGRQQEISGNQSRTEIFSIGQDIPISLANTFYNTASGNLTRGKWQVHAKASVASNLNSPLKSIYKLWDGLSNVYSAGQQTIRALGVNETGVLDIQCNAIIQIVDETSPISLSVATANQNNTIKALPLENFAGIPTGVTTYINCVRLGD